jgi:phosphatidylserine/phosphatidylglycerophosphate/cardiolipin synthase-like enzyme
MDQRIANLPAGTFLALPLLLLSIANSGCYNLIHRLPPGVSYRGEIHHGSQASFLADVTWVDESGERHVEQQVFDAVMRIISRAERFVLIDMFLYNDFQGDPPETTRALSGELTEALIARKRERPAIEILVVSDPVNTIYGGIRSKHFDALQEAGIPVVLTRLDRLRDSNPGYSGFWRLLAKPLGVREGGLLPNPFGDERVSALSYLSLLNFKANHRKLIIADAGDDMVALVSSANPHDGSSAHGNVALEFYGSAVLDLLETERAVLELSDAKLPPIALPELAEPESGPLTMQVVTEGQIRRTLLEGIATSGEGDRVDVAVFYISDHGVIEALIEARRRGAVVRALLDPNKDAFGREKGGIPNRPVAGDLHQGNVAVRWCDTHGEQCHAKLLLVRRASGESLLVMGSANFTRRNLQDLNLETDIAVRGAATSAPIRDAAAWFDLLWNNEPGRIFSVEYEAYADESLRKKFFYEMEERTGLSTF